jgi:hypothetical protein
MKSVVSTRSVQLWQMLRSAEREFLMRVRNGPPARFERLVK